MSNARYNLFPSKPSFTISQPASAQYSVGTESDTNATITYLAPMAFDTSHQVFETNVGNCAQFVTHPSASSYKYIKFTAPVEGLYSFSMCFDIRNHHSGGDYFAFGFMKNTVSPTGSGFVTYPIAAVASTPNGQVGMPSTGNVKISLEENDYVVLYAQSLSEAKFGTTPITLSGCLVS